MSAENTSGKTTIAASQRELSFATENDVIAEIARLRRGYTMNGNWSLPQIAWHLVIPIERFLTPPADPTVKMTPEQLAMKSRFIDVAVKTGKLPPHASTAPPDWTPPASADDSDIARFEAGLMKLKNYPHALVEMGPMGPVPIEDCRRVHLVHAAHHLGFLEPTAKRRIGLRYNNLEEVANDVRSLRRGYTQAGNWTLGQICFHLNTAMNYFCSPPPHPDFGPTPPGAREKLATVLSTGVIPGRIDAPPQAVPSATCGEADIDAFLATLERLRTFAGPYAPHRVFGKLSDDDARKLVLIHCAHHLSFLAPI